MSLVKHKIYVGETNIKTNLLLVTKGEFKDVFVYDDFLCKNSLGVYCNIHILSDGLIEKGDLILDEKRNKVWKYEGGVKYHDKKVIASTDETLNVPKIHLSFVKYFTKNPELSEVQLEYIEFVNTNMKLDMKLKIVHGEVVTVFEPDVEEIPAPNLYSPKERIEELLKKRERLSKKVHTPGLMMELGRVLGAIQEIERIFKI